jgi:nucleoside-diphosphate-sugar epimerase
MSTLKALVAGANGVIGRSAAEHLSARPGWNVIGASRRTAQDQETLQHLSVDLLDPEDCAAKLSELNDITHLIFAAYAERTTPADLVTVNVALLKNLLDAVEPSSPHLRHVTLYQGGKAYGCHLGPFKTPAREDDPRYLGVISITIKRISCECDSSELTGAGPSSDLKRFAVSPWALR